MSIREPGRQPSNQSDGTYQPERDEFSVSLDKPESSEGDRESQWGGRSPAELVTLAASTAIVLGLVAIIAFLYLSGTATEVAIEVSPEFAQIRQESGDYYLPVTIVNQGDMTAEDVIVEATLIATNGQQETSEVTIDFLAGNAREDVVVVFSEDPRDGDLTFDIISFLDP